MKKLIIVIVSLFAIMLQSAIYYVTYVFMTAIFSDDSVGLNNDPTQQVELEHGGGQMSLDEDADRYYGFAQAGYRPDQSGYPPVKEQLPQLIVLINFSDVQITTEPSQWTDHVYGQGKSVNHYFRDMSKGKFELIPVEETQGVENDGIIEIWLSSPHPQLTMSSTDEDYNKATRMFEEVLTEIEEYIDMDQYDLDGNGDVEAGEISLILIAAGYEESDWTPLEQSVAGIFNTEEYFYLIDDVYIGEYVLCGELDMDEGGYTDLNVIGILCHEIGHVIGLPDLYDTDYSSIGLGFHSLMSEGSFNRLPGERFGETPSPMIAWSRIYAGFAEAEVIQYDGEYLMFGQSTPDYNVLRIDTDSGYYLIENVDFNGYGGGLSEYMEHGGIAIWYIDPSALTQERMYENTVNDDDLRRGVVLMEAEGKRELFEEELDYYRTDYEHYFAAGYIDTFVTAEGIGIQVVDEPGREMRVIVDFP